MACARLAHPDGFREMRNSLKEVLRSALDTLGVLRQAITYNPAGRTGGREDNRPVARRFRREPGQFRSSAARSAQQRQEDNWVRDSLRRAHALVGHGDAVVVADAPDRTQHLRRHGLPLQPVGADGRPRRWPCRLSYGLESAADHPTREIVGAQVVHPGGTPRDRGAQPLLIRSG